MRAVYEPRTAICGRRGRARAPLVRVAPHAAWQVDRRGGCRATGL